MIRVVKRGHKQEEGAVRFSVGRKSSGSLLLEATARALAKPLVEPQDLVNVLTMLRRHPNVLTAMLITAQAPDARYLDLEPQYGWLDADKERSQTSS